MSYERTEAKLRALAAQREAERYTACSTPGCRLPEGHDGLHRMVPEIETLRAMLAREREAREAAEARLREVEYLADRWAANGAGQTPEVYAEELRRVLGGER